MAGKKRNLDITDLKILEELQKNARASFTEIGAKVGLTGPAVRERIVRMENDGLICGYTTVIDCALFGDSIRVIVALQARQEFTRKRVPDDYIVETFKNMPGVLQYWSVTGNIDFIVEILLPSMDKLDDLHRALDKLGIFTTYVVVRSERSQAASMFVD